MLYIGNGFSDSMKHDPNMQEYGYELTESEFIDLVNHTRFKSCIGHEKMAKALTRLTGRNIPFNRKAISLTYNDYFIKVSMKDRLPQNPKHVDYNECMTYNLKFFKRQSPDIRLEAENIINKLIKMEE